MSTITFHSKDQGTTHKHLWPAHSTSILSVRLTTLTQSELPKLTLTSLSTIYSPLVLHVQYRAVCARHQNLMRENRKQEIKVVHYNCIPTCNYQCSKVNLYTSMSTITFHS